MRYVLSLIASLIVSSTLMAAQLNVVVVLDASGSMADSFSGNRNISKMEAAKSALNSVLSNLPKDSNIGVVVLPRDGWIYPLGPLDSTKLREAINSVSPGGGTPLGQYMKSGANSLLELRQKNKYGTYKLIVVTDGESSDNITTPLTGAYGILSKGIKVEAIGVDMDSDHTLATQVPYRSANNPDELTNAVRAVLAESSGGDHSEDYEIIASLDPKICFAALQALSENDNNPIGMKPKLDEDGNVMFDANGNVVLEDGNGGGGGLWWVFFLVTGIVVAGFVIFVMSNR